MIRPSARSSVRILAGRWKGRVLEIPESARPTSGRARQALFNLLQDRVAGARVADLYAGSGAIGLEAVSRGAESAVLVELDAEPLRRTLERLGTEAGQVRLLARPVAQAIEELRVRGERFDIVFADPPYSAPEGDEFLSRTGAILETGGVLVLQRDAGSAPTVAPLGLLRLPSREYGRNVFHFFVMR